MPEYPIPLPTASVFEDAGQYVPLLISAVDEYLVQESLWDPADYPAAYGFMQDLIAWLAELLDHYTPGAHMSTYDVTLQPGALSPLLLATLRAGETVLDVRIAIDTPLDAGVALSVGTLAQPALLMAAEANVPGYASVYSTTPAFEFSTTTEVYVFISGTHTTGAARVYLTVEED